MSCNQSPSFQEGCTLMQTLPCEWHPGHSQPCPSTSSIIFAPHQDLGIWRISSAPEDLPAPAQERVSTLATSIGRNTGNPSHFSKKKK